MTGPYLLGGATLVAFLAGWTVNDWRQDAKLQKAQEKVRAEEQIKLDALRLSLDSANSDRLSLAADLAAEKANIKIKYKTITQEVPIYAPKNTDTCNYDLDPGLVRLLNTAARGGIGYSQATIESAGQLSGPMSGQPTDASRNPDGPPD